MNIFIAGGGITGLSAAWFLQKKYPEAKVTLFEKTDRLGGWIRTSREGGYLFEKGPRTFQMGRSPHLLRLIEELNLNILRSSPVAAKRWILHQGKLRSLGSFFPGLLPYLIREYFIPASQAEDESVYDFAVRRFSPRIAETLFDPLALGIYAGDIRKLSLRACFPSLYRWEREQGSIVRGLLSAPKKTKGLFTLEGGMETLIDTLGKRLSIEVVFNASAEVLSPNALLVLGKIRTADRVISALPPAAPSRSLWVVNVAYAGDVLQKKGFGYLAPTAEKESILGVVFDSAIFPSQSSHGETRLTGMVRAEETRPLEAVRSALERHLNVKKAPDYSSVFLAQNAIAQFEVGCALTSGISVDACIERGIGLAQPLRT